MAHFVASKGKAAHGKHQKNDGPSKKV